MTWSQQQIVNNLLVGGFLVVAAVAFSAGWSWLAWFMAFELPGKPPEGKCEQQPVANG